MGPKRAREDLALGLAVGEPVLHRTALSLFIDACRFHPAPFASLSLPSLRASAARLACVGLSSAALVNVATATETSRNFLDLVAACSSSRARSSSGVNVELARCHRLRSGSELSTSASAAWAANRRSSVAACWMADRTSG